MTIQIEKSWILPTHNHHTGSKQNLNDDFDSNTTGDITELRNFGRSSTPTLSLTSTSNATSDSLGLEHSNISSDDTVNPMSSTVRLVHSPEQMNKATFNNNEDFQEVELDFNNR